jgi:cytochrome c-type biogenesis protein CcmE
MQKATIAKIALTAAVILGGAGFLVYSAVGHAQNYQMVDALISGGLDKWQDKDLKVHGFVEAGSIVEVPVDQVETRTFILGKEGKKIRVFSAGPKPDTFKDQSEVVATGRLVPAKDMQAKADALCKALADKGKPSPACPIRTDAEAPFVVDATELMAKCPSKYDGAASNKIDTQYK